MEVRNILVAGTGTMGHGIAQVAAMAGYEVWMHDVDEARIAAARARIEMNLHQGVEKGKLDAASVGPTLARLRAGPDLAAAGARCDLLVEAIHEDLPAKKALFKAADAAFPRHAVLATNTSSLSVSAIAAATKRPGQVVGMHFFNPVHIMKLLEIVRAEETSEQTLRTAREVGARLGKTSILVKDSPGFATSRLGIVLGNEAMRMLEEGVASVEDIDTAMELGYRHPMGPLKLSDHVGLDVRLAVTEYLWKTLKAEQFKPSRRLVTMVKEGKLGVKSGEGFYKWDREE